MGTQTVISVENLGKVYRINHQAQQQPYLSLRDVVSETVRGFFGRNIRQSEKSVSKEDFWALRDVSFEVKEGEVIGVIGRNGAGKSTLLKILSRITEPSEGRVCIKGRIASLLEVGTGFHPELTGRENIYLNGAILGMSRSEIKRKFDEIVAFAEIEKFIDTPVKRYSSGMYVRLAFAVAAHLEPDILIVDEVLSVGDTEFQKKCMGKMQEVHRASRTVFFVSHNMAAIRTLCTRAIQIQNGGIECGGNVDFVINNYLNGAVAYASGGWVRSMGAPASTPIFFTSVEAHLEGRQPRMELICRIRLKCVNNSCPKAFFGMRISDGSGIPLMLVEPNPKPFLELSRGNYLLDIRINLPPLVPNRYLLTPWIESHTTAIDFVENAVEFVIEDTPSPGRYQPHVAEQGFIVPSSTCTVSKAKDDLESDHRFDN